jgi:hypothetical protein
MNISFDYLIFICVVHTYSITESGKDILVQDTANIDTTADEGTVS